MLAKKLCLDYFKNALTSVHAKRAQSLFETSWGLTKQAQLSLTSLGRHKQGDAFVKHKIKSVDRLLGNSLLHQESLSIYQQLFQPLLKGLPTLYLLIDWSGCCGKDFHLLRATLLHDGRGITIYNEIHPQAKLGNADVHKQFLSNLKKIIPFGKKVILITDGGFATPWFYAVIRQGWDFVGRINRNLNIRFDDSWLGSNQIAKEATHRVKYIGTGRLGRKVKKPVRGSVYSYKQKSKGRKDKSNFPSKNKLYSLIHKTPWVLVTSLSQTEFKGNQIKNIYKKRMQIEQTFRDDKNARYGFGWRMGRTKCPKRLPVLCLIACIASFFLGWIGMTAERLGLHKQYQANTVKRKRVLSFIFLAKQIILHATEKIAIEDYQISAKQFVLHHEEFALC